MGKEGVVAQWCGAVSALLALQLALRWSTRAKHKCQIAKLESHLKTYFT